MLKDNLASLRKLRRMTQEDVAERIGVSRQAVSKWESGASEPDLARCMALCALFGVTLDDLVHHDAAQSLGLPVPPRGKHLFGVVSLGDRGQIVIPAKARKVFGLNPGDRLLVLGDEAQGLALMREADFLHMARLVQQAGAGPALGEESAAPLPRRAGTE